MEVFWKAGIQSRVIEITLGQPGKAGLDRDKLQKVGFGGLCHKFC